MHAWDALTPIEETLALPRRRRARTARSRYYGFSNYLGWQLTKAVAARAAPTAGRRRSRCSRSTTCWCAASSTRSCPPRWTRGIGLLPWSPLAGGWLSGKYTRDQAPTGATRLGEDPKRGMEAWEKRNADAAHLGGHRRRRRRRERSIGASSSQVALAWLADRAGRHLGHPRRAHRRRSSPTTSAPPTSRSPTTQLRALDRRERARAPTTTPTARPAIAQRHRKLEGGR